MVFVCAFLTLAPGVASAAFPGANGRIAFSTADQVQAMNPDGSGQGSLTGSGGNYSPSYSADGKQIAFAKQQDGNSEIYVMNANGTGAVRLTNYAGVDDHPVWSPDGTKIAWSRGETTPPFQYDVYVMNANGTGVTNLTNDSALTDVYPSWSPDGTKIAFSSDRVGGDHIYTMNADGTGQTGPLTTGSAPNVHPDWSPDGKKIVFVSFVGGTQYDLTIMNPDGSGLAPVSSSPGSVELNPSWSPDGTKVVFSSYVSPGYTDVYVINRDGSAQTNLTNTSGQSELSPDWQPLYQIPQSAPSVSASLVPSYRQTISSTQCMARGGTSTSHAAPLSVTSCNPPGFLPGTAARFGIQAVGTTSLTVMPGNPATLADEADHAILIDLTDMRAATATGPDYTPVALGPDITTLVRFRLSDTLNGPNQADPATVTDSELAIPVDCATTADPNIGSHCAATTSADGITAGLVKEGRNAVTSLFRVRLRDSGANGIRGDADDREFATQGLYTP